MLGENNFGTLIKSIIAKGEAKFVPFFHDSFPLTREPLPAPRTDFPLTREPLPAPRTDFPMSRKPLCPSTPSGPISVNPVRI